MSNYKDQYEKMSGDVHPAQCGVHGKLCPLEQA